MTSSYTSSIPLRRAPLYQQLVKRHGLWFTRSSIWKDTFTSTVAGDDIGAFNAFHVEWERTKQELDRYDSIAPRARTSLWVRLVGWVRGMLRDVR